ncbi:MAG: type II secretion system protein GspN [Proteobacteria bacterium]|nr:type II secretion system protein GspN [Pseudomonadota bacterium]
MAFDIGRIKLKIKDIYRNKISGLSIKKNLFYAGAGVWFFVLLIVLLNLFFPYQKLFGIAFQNLFVGSKMLVSIEDAKMKPGGGIVSKVVFGHEAMQGKPLFEVEKLRINWNLFLLLKGILNITSDASVYSGTMKANIENIPIMANSLPLLKMSLANVNLAAYPENRLPWFRSISGTLNGWIKEELSFYAPEKKKGNFSINVKNGEIKEISVRDFPRLTIPYDEIVIEGEINGERINLNKIAINSPGNSIKGIGTINMNDYEKKVDLKLYYEALNKNAPLAGKGTITITGKQWPPEVIITPEVPVKTSERAP